MAAFCHFYRVAPSEYWSLTVAEVSAMTKYANDLRKG